MKFAKELEEDLVPEWRVKYFNYKIGKKKIKAVSRALRAANRTPPTPGRPKLNTLLSSDSIRFTHYDFTRQPTEVPTIKVPQPKNAAQAKAQAQLDGNLTDSADLNRRKSVTMFASSPPAPKPQHLSDDEPTEEDGRGESELSSDSDDRGEDDERPLQRTSSRSTAPQKTKRYGSIIASPPGALSALHLPDPALNSPEQLSPKALRAAVPVTSASSPPTLTLSHAPTNAPEFWDQPPSKRKLSNLPKKILKRRSKTAADGGMPKSKPKKARLFTPLPLDSPALPTVHGDAYRELDEKQREFFAFLDKELDKIEKFYKMKEEEAASRLRVLRDQLHEMRDRRLEDLELAAKNSKITDKESTLTQEEVSDSKSIFHSVFDLFVPGSQDKNSQSRQDLSTPSDALAANQPKTNDRGDYVKKQRNDRGDYVRKQQGHEKVPYRFARRKLKLALQEFYRGLELLKSYALLNRTAFRKINKKYDKAVLARPPLRYMSEKVNGAHFTTSTFVEETLVTVEDLYARYFERGNRKVAVNKLRSHLRTGGHSAVSFRNGLYLAAGTGLAVIALIDGSKYLFSDDPQVKLEASYLFQLYAGYFLAVLLFLAFVFNCRIWTRNRINYTFVFEYDTRHVLDWRQLAELPCFFLFLNGLFFWLNFQFHDEHVMYKYWPILLIGITVVIIFLPAKVLYYHARKWWLYSNWRLLLAGLYPVEFRDFYLGDMYCSETYTMSQLEVFFCLYGHAWDDPGQCSSSRSRLLGFLTALPAIWRALQCLRRYYDSRNWFPHLANFAKYCCNISYYMTLSLYRIQTDSRMKALFIVFALINGLYCSFWDVFMDFSLGNPWSKNFLLRDNLGFRRKWVYYAVVIIDVALRQQWVFYAIFTEDIQHAAVTSFMVALAEVFRRGCWSIFRVENEHCNNVQLFRASRDIPLPYEVPSSPEEGPRMIIPSKKPVRSDAGSVENGDLTRLNTSSSTLRTRRSSIFQDTPGLRALRRVGTVIAAAHAQDFQKKRTVEMEERSPADDHMMMQRLTDSSDEGENDENRRPSDGTLRQLDSRESNEIRRRHTRRDDFHNPEASGSGSSSRPRSSRNDVGADVDAVDMADDENDAEINEARVRVARATK